MVDVSPDTMHDLTDELEDEARIVSHKGGDLHFGYNDARYADAVIELSYPALCTSDLASSRQTEQENKGGASCQRSIHVNRLTLAKHSSYFRTLFTTCMQDGTKVPGKRKRATSGSSEEDGLDSSPEQIQLMPCYKLPVTSEAAGELFLKCLYSDAVLEKSVILPVEGIIELLMTANMYLAPQIVEQCALALFNRARHDVSAAVEVMKHICPFNDQGTFITSMDKLIRGADLCIRKAFMDSNVIMSEQLDQFFNLPLPAVEAILDNFKLLATSENTVFCLALSWVRKNIEGTAERKKALRKLTSSPMFCRLSGEFLVGIQQLPEVSQDMLLTGLCRKLTKAKARSEIYEDDYKSKKKLAGKVLDVRLEVTEESVLSLDTKGTIRGSDAFVDGYSFRAELAHNGNDTVGLWLCLNTSHANRDVFVLPNAVANLEYSYAVPLKEGSPKFALFTTNGRFGEKDAFPGYDPKAKDATTHRLKEYFTQGKAELIFRVQPAS